MKAYELLSDKSKWTKGTYARSDGFAVDPENPDAQCWCLVGALDRCYGSTSFTEFRRSATAKLMSSPLLRSRSKYGSIPDFNDHPDTTYEEVVSLLKEYDI